MTALSQARIPAAFQRSAAQFGVAESDFLVLTSLGIHSYESFALRIHAKENLEEFLREYNYTTLITLHYNYNSNCTTPHYIQQLWAR